MTLFTVTHSPRDAGLALVVTAVVPLIPWMTGNQLGMVLSDTSNRFIKAVQIDEIGCDGSHEPKYLLK